MAQRQLERILHTAWRAIRSPAGEESSDGSLLERFAVTQDEEAFETLLRRHGPMVMGVCRRVLSDAHEIEDVFQATFLVLLSKAGSLSRSGTLAGWLYTVAFHLALKARGRAARRQNQEKPSWDMDMHAAPSPQPQPSELTAVLDEELSRLPEKYRLPLVLCYLEGKSNEEAAEQLGCALGTVWGRLSRGRDLLRDRMTRRGLALPAGGLAVLLTQEAASASVPASLMTATKQLALLMAPGQTAAAAAGPAALAAGMLRSMWLAQLRLVAAAVCLLGLGAAGATWLHSQVADRPVAPAPLAGPETAPPRPAEPPEPLAVSLEAVQTLIRPQADEMPWQQVPWQLQLWEARRQAAREGKPIFLWSAAGASPLGACEGSGRESRTAAQWTPAAVETLRQHFIPLAVDGRHLMARQDDEGQFAREHQLRLPPWGSCFVVVTAEGRLLRGQTQNLERALTDGLAAWNRLPASDRAAGAVVVGEAGPADPARLTPDPPPGGLILRHYYRLLTRADGQLRPGRHEDFPLRPQPARSYLLDAQPDYMWLTAAEAKALLPPAAVVGERWPVPAAIQERLFRYHLNPILAVAETSSSFSTKQIRGGELILTVEEASAAAIRLRLDGYALLGREYDPEQDDDPEAALEGGLGYEPRLSGTLLYDRQQESWSRIELVALGDVFGAPGGSSDLFYRPGRQPLGVFFELVSTDLPAHRVPPRSYRSCNKLNSHYFPFVKPEPKRPRPAKP